MKFNKIEISAFRIYNNPENACFDFTTKTGSTADFISLYSPNGFGKTSFYDAVEWGITGAVNRFFIRNKEMSKLEKNQSTINEIPLLRNSKLERDTYVKVFSNSQKKPFENHISKESIELDLPLKTNIGSHEFHKVILSQEWISAFLTEKDGEQRYKKFMENPELSEINNYYINLKHLLSVQQAEEKQLQQDIKRLQEKVKDIEDENLLETINHQINYLISVYKQNDLCPIDIETTNKELIYFKGLLSKKIIQYTTKKDKLLKKIDLLRTAKVGNDDLLGLKSYDESKLLLPKLHQNIKDIEHLIGKFEEHDKLINQFGKKKNLLKEYSLKREALELVLLKFNQYEIVKNEIKAKIESQNGLEKELRELNKAVEELKREEISANEQLKSCLRQIEDNEERTTLLPSLQKDIVEFDKSIRDTENANIEQLHVKEKNEKKLKQLRDLFIYYETFLTQIDQAEYSKEVIKERPELVQTVAEIEKCHEDIFKEKERLASLNIQIEQQKVLNSDIQEFIEKGLELINKRQSSICPLCEQPYSDFRTLSSKISGNKALSQNLKKLFEQKQNVSNVLNLLEVTVRSGRKKLSDFYNEKKDNINIKIDEVSVELEKIKKRIHEIIEHQSNLKAKRSELVTSMNGMSFIDYEKQLKDQNIKNLAFKIKLTRTLNFCKENFNEQSEKNEKVKCQIKLLKEEIEGLSKNVVYQFIVNYFKENYPSDNISKLLLTNSFEDFEQTILSLNEDIKSLTSLLSPLNDKLSMYNNDSLKADKIEFEKQSISLNKSLDRYTLFLKENFDINAKVYDVNELKAVFESKNSDSKKELELSKLIYDKYIAIEKSSEHIIEFLQTEQTKILIKEKTDELEFLFYSVRENLLKERESAKEFLKERIKDFFYENLINKLYEKIDPHPDFKKVIFIPNLDVEPPRLDVFVKNENTETLIPNLYFSTAQITILSLCIFLASALKSNDYDCIFIDDPIQSMDSINVLSTIDLLRSLVVNNGKQIIISTHDENFHNLLKKKIPRDLFQSKFLKLESFGKVIEDKA